MLTDSLRFSEINRRDRNTREVMRHLEMPKAILLWLLWRDDEILCNGLCSIVSEAFMGELRHIMKSANGTAHKSNQIFHLLSLAPFIKVIEMLHVINS